MSTARRPRRLVKRRGVMLVVALLWSGLDLARSWNGHRAYRTPRQMWQPEPALAVDIAWPPRVKSDATDPGARAFALHCAVCHGPEGRGNGPASPSMRPRPRDLSSGEFKFKSTAQGQGPTDEDLLRTVRDGLNASAMPGFGDVLNPDELTAVARYVRDLSHAPGGTVVAAPDTVPSPERGRVLYAAKGCAACHGEDGRLRKAFYENGGVVSPDLTQPWSFHGGATPAALIQRLTSGILPGPMPSYAEATTPDERADIAAFVLSWAQPPPWDGGTLAGLGQQPDFVRRGEYISRAGMCSLCHTQTSALGIYRDEFRLGGGMSVGAYPHGTYVSRNLSPDPSALGGRSEDSVVETIQLGHAPGRQISLWAMPWPVFSRFRGDDAHALARYLLQRPALPRIVPLPVHYGAIESLVMKLVRELPAAAPTRLIYRTGDFADLPSLEPVERWLMGIQAWVLGLGVLAWMFAGPRPRTWKGRLRWALIAAGFLALGGVLGLIVQLPALPQIPVATLADAMLPRLPPPSSDALRERGRYLYQVASCAFCHQGDGAGGAKISWRGMGTIYVRNISSDPKHGLGQWTNAQVARAIRSGVSRDGRSLHWQAMPWDLFSNFEEEDIRALVAFVRSLPPVPHAVPLPRPSDPSDCEEYSFFVTPDLPAGCG